MIIKIIIALIIIILGALLIKKLTSSRRIVPTKSNACNSTGEKTTSHHPHFMNTALFSLDSKKEQCLFIGGYKQADKLFLIKNGRLVDVTQRAGLMSTSNITYCVIAADTNNDGLADLYVARDDGFYLYENRQGVLKAKKLNIDLSNDLIPVSMAIADLQKTGVVDLFITACPKIICPNLQQTTPYQSFLFKNKGNDTFINITQDLKLDFL